MLDDAAIFSGGIEGDAAFVNVVAAGFFDVDIFAGLAGPDGDERVPMIGRGDGDRVHIFVFEDFSDVCLGFGGCLGVIFDLLDLGGEEAAVGIDEVGDADAFDVFVFADVTVAAAIDAGDGDANGFVGAAEIACRFGAGDEE